jgi:hypothetical protein
MFRWVPSTAVEFDGSLSPAIPLDLRAEWSLVDESNAIFPVYITTATFGSKPPRVAGILPESLNLGGDSSFELLRFSLANFPDYLGEGIRCQNEETQSYLAGRLNLSSAQGICQLDVVPEAAELRKRAHRGGGFVISHVGQWLPSNGEMSVQDAEEALELLRVWFGFLRGSWTGPLFPQGLRTGSVVWRQFAEWDLRESRHVTTWLPERRPVDLGAAFSRFAQLWANPNWRDPLRLAVSWFIEANSLGRSLEPKIVLSQVALELLASVHLVETQRIHSHKDFKTLSAAGKIRALLDHIDVPASIPTYLNTLLALCHGDAFDGPGVIATVRNNLVHATDNNRAAVKALSPQQLYQCSELALQYVELAILAICGYTGHYARRGWQGWKGDDEILVPWSQAS